MDSPSFFIVKKTVISVESLHFSQECAVVWRCSICIVYLLDLPENIWHLHYMENISYLVSKCFLESNIREHQKILGEIVIVLNIWDWGCQIESSTTAVVFSAGCGMSHRPFNLSLHPSYALNIVLSRCRVPPRIRPEYRELPWLSTSLCLGQCSS